MEIAPGIQFPEAVPEVGTSEGRCIIRACDATFERSTWDEKTELRLLMQLPGRQRTGNAKDF